MKITKILAISAFSVLLTACGQQASQSQIEGSAPAVVAGSSVGPEHIHNVQGHGDHKHSHKGNSTASHGHSYESMMKEMNP